MDRSTRNLLLLAIAVIVVLYLLSGRTVPILGSLRAQEIDVDTEIPLPTIIPNATANANLDVEVPETVVVDPNVEVTAKTVTPGPLLNLDSPPGFLSGILHGCMIFK